MPYKVVEPASEEEMIDFVKIIPIDVGTMKKKRYHGHNTICEKLREIYVKSGDQEIRLKCRIAMSMAKSMHEKLKKYRDETILREGKQT